MTSLCARRWRRVGKWEGFTTYRGSELGRLGGLPALLAYGRQRGVEGGYVVGGEASMQLATHIASTRAGGVGGKGAAQRGGEAEGGKRLLLLARGAQTAAVANAGGEGHVQLEIHCIAVRMAVPRIWSRWGREGGEEGCCSWGHAARACPRRTAHTTAWPDTDTQRALPTQSRYSYSYTGPVPSVAFVERAQAREVGGLRAEVGSEGAVVGLQVARGEA